MNNYKKILLKTFIAAIVTPLFFALFYRLINMSNPHSFYGLNSLPDFVNFSYFTAVSLGYGDIIVNSNLARASVSCEIFIVAAECIAIPVLLILALASKLLNIYKNKI